MGPDVRDLILPHIRQMNTYSGLDPMEVMAEQAGIPPEKIIRLNGNENPFGSSPEVIRVLGSSQSYNRYPGHEVQKATEALSEYLGAPANQIVLGNGSGELIDLIVRMFVGPGDNIVIPTPTFGMYSFWAEASGGRVKSVPRTDDFEIDLGATRVAVDGQAKVIFLASPNNPSGNLASDSDVKALLSTGIVVVVDETYFEFCGHTVMPLIGNHPNLVVLRTFSKWAGLAGLRVGLGVMHPDLVSRMMGIKSPYNINSAALAALSASLDDRQLLLDRVQAITAERERMSGLLENIPGVHVWPSQANFILCQLPEGRGKQIFESLCRRGIFLRYFDTPRLRDYVRIGVGLPDETDQVIAALAELVSC